MKILVLGNGFVGAPLAKHLGATTLTKRLNEIDVADLDGYDVVINTAAKTAIDWCEKNKQETFDTNVTQALRIAKLVKGKYVFFSSACIFKSVDGEIMYEDSRPNPQCFYTYTKLMAETLIMDAVPTALIIRPRLLISETSHPRNTIDKLFKYDKVVTCQESATVLEDLINVIPNLLDQSGPFNIANKGTVSPAEIMDLWGRPYQKITKQELDVLTQGMATRVSTILGSKRLTPELQLPDIHDRLLEIRNKWL